MSEVMNVGVMNVGQSLISLFLLVCHPGFFYVCYITIIRNVTPTILFVVTVALQSPVHLRVLFRSSMTYEFSYSWYLQYKYKQYHTTSTSPQRQSPIASSTLSDQVFLNRDLPTCKHRFRTLYLQLPKEIFQKNLGGKLTKWVTLHVLNEHMQERLTAGVIILVSKSLQLDKNVLRKHSDQNDLCVNSPCFPRVFVEI